MEKTIEKIDIRSLNYKELQEEMTRIGEKAFRGKQIYAVAACEAGGQLSGDDQSFQQLCGKSWKQQLCDPRRWMMLEHHISKKDPTEKFLFELEDGNVVESVLMKYNYGNSVCISSQVGLPDGMPVLCLDHWRTGTKSDYIRDAGTGVPNSEDQQESGYPMSWSWEPESHWIITIIF